MSGSWSAESETSQFRIEKARTDGTLLLSNGLSLYGSFFVAGSSATHAGPERIKDVLNAEPGFFPFEVLGADGSKHTTLYNRDHIVFVELAGNQEAALDPGYDVATRRTVSMMLSNGTSGSRRHEPPTGLKGPIASVISRARQEIPRSRDAGSPIGETADIGHHQRGRILS